MELYLDSADVREIDQAFELGYLAGLTTTPTFMHRHGITDIDGAIVELSKKVPVLQIEALGATADEIVAEALRQDALGLDKNTTVYKIPMSLEGTKACKTLAPGLHPATSLHGDGSGRYLHLSFGRSITRSRH
jgi:transaldolase